MSFEFSNKLPIPKDTKERYPMSEETIRIKEQRDKEIRDAFTGKSDKFVVIVGPCSADHEDPVMEYANRLAKVQEEVKDKLILIPRVYTGKPRTTGLGYKGILHQPDPEKKPNLYEGILMVRKLHMRVMQETGLTTADEMLYSENYRYLSDVLSYVAVGARSVEDQQHRLTASGMDIPVGMKNPTGGDLSVMMNSIIAGQASHEFIFRGWAVQTTGNDLTHAILRGYTDKHGKNFPNYHYEDLQDLCKLYAEKDYKYPACIVDTNHANSGKQFKEQIRISKEVLHSMRHSEDIHKLVKGLMIESYLEEGCQKIGDGVFGRSITDPCLGWKDTENLLYYIAETI
ncbi:2-keto-3-deoxy-D-arabino-heptulosonate-7- phosphate synthase I alpha [Lachnospiraceae bacterium TWA4]|nr:2-keto-3-deoxy-D-arabino-heptulosonate-7- phosphate synthase I alpha [Lachnospiraceae bacterium TWA4]